MRGNEEGVIEVKRVVVLIVSLWVIIAGQGHANADDHSFPNCIGSICIDHKWTDPMGFFEEFGMGMACTGNFPIHWYYTKDGKWVAVGRYHGDPNPINHVMVSKYPIIPCYMPPAPYKDFGNLTIGREIEIGSTKDDVISAYGTPVYVYSDAHVVWRLVPGEWNKYDLKKITIFEYYPNDYVDSVDDLPKLVLTVYFEESTVIALTLDWPPG
jgi:hypothetical protein